MANTRTKAKANAEAKSKFKPKGEAAGPRYLLSGSRGITVRNHRNPKNPPCLRVPVTGFILATYVFLALRAFVQFLRNHDG